MKTIVKIEGKAKKVFPLIKILSLQCGEKTLGQLEKEGKTLNLKLN